MLVLGIAASACSTPVPIDLRDESDVVIENLNVSNPDGVCIRIVRGSNVTIRNSKIGPCGEEAIYLSDVQGAVITGNEVVDTGNGVVVHASTSVRVDENTFTDSGRNFVQFDKVNGPDLSISGNRGENRLGESNAEDFISLFQSNGTAESPIRVVGNHLRNGGPSDSGSGIMLGDGGGSHQIAEGNHLVNPGQVGIGVAGGDAIWVIDNSIYGSDVAWSNVGIFVWDINEEGCGSVEVADNQVSWTAAGGTDNPFWDGGGCSLDMHDNDLSAAIGPSIWEE